MKLLFLRISSYEFRKNWYADEWSRPAPMVKSAATVATTVSHRLSFAAIVVRCSAEFTGTIAAANPSSGAASVGWNLPVKNLMKYCSYDHTLYTSIHNDGHQILIGHLNMHYNGHNTNQSLEIFHSSSLPPSSSRCVASYSLIPLIISSFAFSISASFFFFLDLK